MMKWRGLSVAIVLAAVMAAAWAGAARHDEKLEIPWATLTLATQQRLRDVTQHATFSRDILGITINSQQAVFDFLIEHPDFAANAGRIMGIVKYRVLKERDGLYWGDDAHGATGTFELVHAERGKRIYLTKGTFVKRFLPTIYGRIVLILAWEHRSNRAGMSRVINDVRGYLRIDNPVLGILASLAKPVVGPIVDRKVRRSFATAARLTSLASNDPMTLYQTLAASNEMAESDLRAFRKVLRCCVETDAES